MTTRLPRTPDRSSFRQLGIVLVVLALAMGAGCSGITGGDGGGDGGPSGVNMIEHVPADQNVLMYVDMKITQDETTQRLMQASDDEDAPSDQELQDDLNEIEEETGLDPREVDEILMFGQTDDVAGATSGPNSEGTFGIIANTGWTEDEVKAAFEASEESSLSEGDYRQSGVFFRVQGADDTADDEPTYLGILGDGAYVLGDKSAVKATLDIEYGSGEVLSGTLRDAYDDTRDGYIQFAMTVPEDTGGTGGGMGMGGQVEALTGVYYTSGDTVGMEGRMIMSDSQIAQQYAGFIQMAITSQVQDPEAQKALENLEIGSDGNAVTFTYEASVDELIELQDS